MSHSARYHLVWNAKRRGVVLAHTQCNTLRRHSHTYIYCVHTHTYINHCLCSCLVLIFSELAAFPTFHFSSLAHFSFSTCTYAHANGEFKVRLTKQQEGALAVSLECTHVSVIDRRWRYLTERLMEEAYASLYLGLGYLATRRFQLQNLK